MLSLLALTALSASLLQPSPKLYKDWIVGCDNVRACQANALNPPDNTDDYLMMTITRSGVPGDTAKLSVPLPYETIPGARFALKVDGILRAAFAAQSGDVQTIALTRPLLRALAGGHRFALFDAHGHNVGKGSLAGLTAALRYIDARQHRLGTVDALQATGTKPDTSVPAPPAMPVIETPAQSSKPPRRISVALATKLLGPDAYICKDYGKIHPRSYRLDAGHSLVLIDHFCDGGAYNLPTSVYVLGESGPPRLARFDVGPGFSDGSEDPETGELINGAWDPKSRRISSYELVRGIGDCGTSEIYAWDGNRFRTTEAKEMGECRGSKDYIRTWTARTSR